MRKMRTFSKALSAAAVAAFVLVQCSPKETMKFKVYETSRSGSLLKEVAVESATGVAEDELVVLSVDPKVIRQTITGFGGAFTEASAYLLNQLGQENRDKILQAYFSKEGAAYSLARTHMNSCDFSRSNYSYTPVEGDTALEHFSVEVDRADLIPMIKDAQAISVDGFKLFASPWTAAPWMKDNNSWVGGKLKPEYYPVWASVFSKYVDAYAEEGIDIWGFTVENEPHGNGNNWESMLFSPQEMTDFVVNHLGPQLERDGKGDLVILGYDQNREGIKEWVDVMYGDEKSANQYDGTAIHWYESTVDYFPEMLEYAHAKAPEKLLIQTEACIDAEVPVWRDDEWYWKKEATDWGYTWREPEKKYLHPKYAPAHRYARDIIGCLNHWVDGWVDWNMVLDKQGGPNWKENWCIAPVIVDPEQDEVYFTPLYYVMAHFSKFMRPGGEVLASSLSDPGIMAAAVRNTDGTTAIAVFNEQETAVDYKLVLGGEERVLHIGAQTLQTVVIEPKNNTDE